MTDDSILYGYCQCGCGRKTGISRANVPARGYVLGEPMPYVLNHRKRITGTRYQVVDCGYQTPCELWTGYIDEWGYGRVAPRADGEVLVHRIAWIEKYGPVPPGYDVHHKCGQRHCRNVDHLELMTRQDHSRLHASGRRRVQRTHCQRGHEYTSENTGYGKGGYRYCRACARLRKRNEYQRKYAHPPPPRTHCARGHELTPENTYIYGNHRVCRQCNRESALAHYHRNKDRRQRRSSMTPKGLLTE